MRVAKVAKAVNWTGNNLVTTDRNWQGMKDRDAGPTFSRRGNTSQSIFSPTEPYPYHHRRRRGDQDSRLWLESCLFCRMA